MRTNSRSTALARAVAAVSVGATVAGILLPMAVGAPIHSGIIPGPTPVLAMGGAPLAALLLARRPGNRVGLLLLWGGFSLAVYTLALGATQYGLMTAQGLSDHGAAWWLPWTAWLAQWTWLGGLSIVVFLPQLFPDGSPLPGRGWRNCWRFTKYATAAIMALFPLLPFDSEATPLAHPFLPAHLGSLSLPSDAVAWALTGVTSAFAAITVASVTARYRRADGAERTRIGLVALALAVLGISFASNLSWLQMGAAVFLLIAMLVAVLKLGLFDIDRLLPRTLAATVAALLAAALFTAAATGTGVLLGDVRTAVSAAWAAACAVAAALMLVGSGPVRALERATWPGRTSLPRLIDTVQEVARAASTPGMALENVVYEVNKALRSSRLSAPAQRPRPPSLSPAPPLQTTPPPSGPADATRTETTGDTGTLAYPLLWRQEPLGWALLIPEVHGARIPACDRRTVSALVPVLEALVRDHLLTVDLEASRHAVVMEREEERRRIRRELHDGLGPLLAGAALSLGVAHDATGPEAPALRHELLSDAGADLRRAIADVRELSYGLRPPALDDAGMVEAIRRVCTALPLPVHLTADSALLTDIPAAVEVAVFRIASEALANVGRHAGAASAAVTLQRTQVALILTVTDDGVGLAGWVPGVGVLSMRERAAEVGGQTVFRTASGGGTIVEARFPLASGTPVWMAAGVSSPPAIPEPAP